MTTYTFPDGGEASWEEFVDIKTVGDHGIPAIIKYRHPGGASQPAYEADIEVWDGVPVCSRVQITGKPDAKAHVRVKDINLIADSIEDVIEGLSAIAAYRKSGQDWAKAWPTSAEDRTKSLRSIRLARQQVRRKMTLDRLQQIADTYNAAPPPKIEAVAVAFGKSARTAARYVAEAKGQGLIDE